MSAFPHAIWRTALVLVFGLVTGLATPHAKPSDTVPPRFQRAPVLKANPNPSVPLAGVLSFSANESVTVHLTITDDKTGDRWSVDYRELAAAHTNLPVLGFRPGRKHSVAVRIADAAGNVTPYERALTFTTGALPTGFPLIKLVVPADPLRSEPGVTVFVVFSPVIDRYLVAVDRSGEVVWYYRAAADPYEPRKLANGHVLFLESDTRLVEMDMLGNVVASWHTTHHPSPPQGSLLLEGVDYCHHDVFPMPDDHIALLCKELRRNVVYPSSAEIRDAPALPSANVLADRIVEIDRRGEVVHSYSLWDLLVPRDEAGRYARPLIGYYSFMQPIGWFLREIRSFVPKDLAYDWSHGNTVTYVAEDDSFLFSARNLNAVVKFRRSTGEIVWILSPHENWPAQLQPYLLTPRYDVARYATIQAFWPYSQHSPIALPNGNVLLFDNGTYRASAFGKPWLPTDNFSRAVEYHVDPGARTVEIPWEYRRADLFAHFVGSVRWLPSTGNILSGFLAVTTVGDGKGRCVKSQDWGHESWQEIVETTHAYGQAPQVVFELRIGETACGDGHTNYGYRADRWPSLY